MTLDWRLNVWDATGGNPRTIERDSTFIRSSGLRMALTPEGDGVAASFQAKGAGLQVPPLSCVQVEHLLDGTWTPLYYGQVMTGGNQMDVNGEGYDLASLTRKLGRVTLSPGFSTPQQPAHLTIQAMIADVVGSGQLGTPSLITYDAARIPDLGFDAVPIKAANQDSPLTFLEQLAQQGAATVPAVNIRYGVGPDRVFYCTLAKTDTLTLTADDIGRQVWKSPTAEGVCTRVLWFIAQREDQSWLTHLSERMPNDPYGVETQREPIPPGVNVWKTIPGGTYTWYRFNGSSYVLSGSQPTLDPTIIKDGKFNEVDGVSIGNFTGPDIIALELTAPTPIQRVSYGLRAMYGTDLTVPSGFLVRGGPVNAYVDLGSKYLPPGYNAGSWTLPGNGQTRLYFEASNSNSDTTATRWVVAEMHIEEVNTDLLDSMARFLYRVPAQEPSEIVLKGLLPPSGLTGIVSAGTYSRPMDRWEYRLSGGDGLVLVAQAGQADDPLKLAQAAAIRAQARNATLNAITAPR